MPRNEHRENRWLMAGSLVILATVALAVALAYTRTVMVPFVLALFIVSIFSPLLSFLIIRLKLPRIIAVTITLSVVVLIMSVMSLLVITGLQNVASLIYSYTDSDNVQELAERVYSKYDNILYWLENVGRADANGIPEPNSDTILTKSPSNQSDVGIVQFEFTPEGLRVREVPDGNDTQSATTSPSSETSTPPDVRTPPRSGRITVTQFIRQFRQVIVNLFQDAIGVLWNMVFVIIFVIFLLSGYNPRAVRSEVYADIDLKIRKYIVTKLGVSAVTGILVWVVLRLIGLELAVVFGILAFMLNFIPSIGSVISTFLPLPVALAQFQGELMPILLVLLIPGGIQMVMGNGVEPKLMGEGLNLHPVTVLLALSFWGLLWGVVGMFLAAPITAVLRIILMQFEAFKPLGELLAGKLPVINSNHSD